MAEIFAFERGLRNDGQIARGGIVILIVQTVGIAEMRVEAAKFVGALVHHADKIRNGTGNMLGDDVAGVVAGDDHHAVQQIFQRHLLTDLKPCDARINVQILERGCRNGHNVGQIAVFQCQQTGHDLRQAGRIDALVRVLFIDGTARVEIDEERGLGRDRKACPRGQQLILRHAVVCRCGIRAVALRLLRVFRRLSVHREKRQRQGRQQQEHGKQQGKNLRFFHFYLHFILFGLYRIKKIWYTDCVS